MCYWGVWGESLTDGQLGLAKHTLRCLLRKPSCPCWQVQILQNHQHTVACACWLQWQHSCEHRSWAAAMSTGCAFNASKSRCQSLSCSYFPCAYFPCASEKAIPIKTLAKTLGPSEAPTGPLTYASTVCMKPRLAGWCFQGSVPLSPVFTVMMCCTVLMHMQMAGQPAWAAVEG